MGVSLAFNGLLIASCITRVLLFRRSRTVRISCQHALEYCRLAGVVRDTCPICSNVFERKKVHISSESSAPCSLPGSTLEYPCGAEATFVILGPMRSGLQSDTRGVDVTLLGQIVHLQMGHLDNLKIYHLDNVVPRLQ